MIRKTRLYFRLCFLSSHFFDLGFGLLYWAVPRERKPRWTGQITVHLVKFRHDSEGRLGLFVGKVQGFFARGFLFFNFSRVVTARSHGAQPSELAEPMGKNGRNKETEDPIPARP